MKKLIAIILLLLLSKLATATDYKCRDLITNKMYLGTVACTSSQIEIYHRDLGKAEIVNPYGNELLTDHIFPYGSVWYAPIPLNAPLDPNSANLTADFLRQKAKYFGTVGVNTTQYAAPVYLADASMPRVQVNFNNCQGKTTLPTSFITQMNSVPIPSYALPSDGTDAEMAVYKPSTNEYWEMWKTVKDAKGNWSACWGGKIDDTRLNEGVFPTYYGTTATSLPFIGGQVTAEELVRGEIKHAIGISLVEAEQRTIFSYPAHRSDGYNPTGVPNRIAEGQRFRLDPNVNVDLLPLSPAGKTIAKAAQKYGFIVWDHAGALSIRLSNPIAQTSKGLVNPYTAVFAGEAMWHVLSGVPWNKLQFFPMNYGKP